jgi:hypothetical protein
LVINLKAAEVAAHTVNFDIVAVDIPKGLASESITALCVPT